MHRVLFMTLYFHEFCENCVGSWKFNLCCISYWNEEGHLWNFKHELSACNQFVIVKNTCIWYFVSTVIVITWLANVLIPLDENLLLTPDVSVASKAFWLSVHVGFVSYGACINAYTGCWTYLQGYVHGNVQGCEMLKRLLLYKVSFLK